MQIEGRNFPIPAATYIAHEICKGTLTVLEDGGVHDIPTQRRRVALWIVLLIVVAAAALAWLTGLVT